MCITAVIHYFNFNNMTYYFNHNMIIFSIVYEFILQNLTNNIIIHIQNKLPFKIPNNCYFYKYKISKNATIFFKDIASTHVYTFMDIGKVQLHYSVYICICA